MIHKTGKIDDLFAEELEKRMKKKAALEVTDKRLEEQRDKMDRDPLRETTEQGLSKSPRGKENDEPSLIDKKLTEKKLPTENSKLHGVTEKRLDTAKTSPYPHRNPEAWERTGDARQINNLEPEMRESSDPKRLERFEKADKAAQNEPKRILDKDIGKQLTLDWGQKGEKKAFNLKRRESAIKYAKYVEYLKYKDSKKYSSKLAEVKEIDKKLASIMGEKKILTVEQQGTVDALKAKKSALLRLIG